MDSGYPDLSGTAPFFPAPDAAGEDFVVQYRLMHVFDDDRHVSGVLAMEIANLADEAVTSLHESIDSPRHYRLGDGPVEAVDLLPGSITLLNSGSFFGGAPPAKRSSGSSSTPATGGGRKTALLEGSETLSD